MKTISFCIIALLLGFGVVPLYGQSIEYNNLPYRPWESFKGDTVAYLNYNYGNRNYEGVRKKPFKRLKVSDLFDELELPVTYVAGGLSSWVDEKKELCTSAIYLGISQTGILPNEIIDVYIVIFFPKPLCTYGITGLNLKSGEPWTPQLYEALKDVDLSVVYFNSMYPPKGREDMFERAKKWQRENYDRVKAEERERERRRAEIERRQTEELECRLLKVN